MEEQKTSNDRGLEEVKDRQSRLEEAFSNIQTQLTEIKRSLATRQETGEPGLEVPNPPIDLPPPIDYTPLHRAISSYLSSCSPELKGKVLGTLLVPFIQMWLQKIEANPQDKSVARINIGTPKFKTEVGTVSGIEVLMTQLGFALNGNFWEFTAERIPELREGYRILSEEQVRYKASIPPPTFVPTKPWLISQAQTTPDPLPKEDAKVTTPVPILQTDPKLVLEQPATVPVIEEIKDSK